MTPELLQELSEYPIFPEGAKELIRVAGMEAAARLIFAWGGQAWPVPVRSGSACASGARRYDSLCSIVGETAAQRIVGHWACLKMNIPNLKVVILARARKLIAQDFDTLTMQQGYSSNEAIFELGIRYGVTGKTVENALKDKAAWKRKTQEVPSATFRI